jgi:hypothetical protein
MPLASLTQWCVSQNIASTHKEWEFKIKSVKTNLSTTAAKFDAGLTSLAVFQWQQLPAQILGFWNGEVVKEGFHQSSGGYEEIVMPPSPQSLSANSNRQRPRQKQTSSSHGRGRLTSIEVVEHGAESESSTTSTHTSLG